MMTISRTSCKPLNEISFVQESIILELLCIMKSKMACFPLEVFRWSRVAVVKERLATITYNPK